MQLIDADALLKDISAARECGGMDEIVAGTLRRYILRQPVIAQPNEWINMEDRPPEFPGFLDHIMVITCNKNDYVIPMVRERTLVGYEWTERWLFPWNEIYVGPEITHWMQMPKPPNVTENVAFSTTTKSGCEYCSGDPMRPLDRQYGLDHIFPDYKYCPMCGRYLKGKNENECK